MSAQPTVVAVCLTADRPDMTRQAVASFRAQTYPAKRLLIYDTGATRVHLEPANDVIRAVMPQPDKRQTVGGLRNLATGLWARDCDIICHWDSDDWSHLHRIAEQVALLQASGAECVGYNEMLFWREYGPRRATFAEENISDGGMPLDQWRSEGEAWLYMNRSAVWALGTSLCYWRSAWERAPFAALNSGEDTEWFNRVKVHAIGSFCQGCCNPHPGPHVPRMVARIHAGNAGNPAYWPAEMLKAPHHWRRVPEWDGYCREVFAK